MNIVALLLSMVLAAFSFFSFVPTSRTISYFPPTESSSVEAPVALLDIADWSERFATAWEAKHDDSYTLLPGDTFSPGDSYMDLAYVWVDDALMLEVYQWLDSGDIWFALTLFEDLASTDESNALDERFTDMILCSLMAYLDGLTPDNAESLQEHLLDSIAHVRENMDENQVGETELIYNEYYFSVSYDGEYGWLDCYYCLN